MKKTQGMNMNINVITVCSGIPECMMVEEIRHVTEADNHQNVLSSYVMNSWPSVRAEVKDEIQPY